MNEIIIKDLIKIIIATSIFFVWVIRYKNIINEFAQYNLPNWLRDLVGILKLSFAAMLFNTHTEIIGAYGIVLLMICAFLTHLKVHNKAYKMLPSLSLIILAFIIGFQNTNFSNETKSARGPAHGNCDVSFISK